MREVLISIQPKWVEKICRGEKTVEVRKTKPKLDVPFKCYIYETKGKLRWCNKCNNTDCERPYPNCACHEGWGKVIGEFVCDRVSGGAGEYAVYHNEGTCLTPTEIADYIGDKYAYYWHISDLKIYDKPRELYDFVNYNKHERCLEKGCFSGDCWGCPDNAIMVLPPQSWAYVKAIEPRQTAD